MMENRQPRLNIEFSHYKCFAAITKLILGSHFMLLSPKQML